MSIALVVLTHDRLHLLKQCVERVLGRVSPETREIVIWNNGSTDGTADFLDTLDDPRVAVVHHPTNIGQNAYAEAFRRTTSEYLLEVDDDIIDAPLNWDATLLDAFRRLPDVGYLAANLVDNPHDDTARAMYGVNAHLYHTEAINGVRLKAGGPVGGGCTITSRDLNARVGGFHQDRTKTFFLEAAAYIRAISKLGYRAAYLEDLKVVHAGGSHYAPLLAEKHEFWRRYYRRAARRNAVKRVLLGVPLVRPLNERYGFFRLQPVPEAPASGARRGGTHDS